ncbi:Gis4p [Lachancea thermotolerans CBS 6340]|uniref:KLTH0G03740p n=1 Tax=Lachancea thermotolerans (strain ATCC 56472 / CBS 6340 / NRRL Y-8284) TaxID=559295 RepID=C5DLV0_LACTC|nr:KLTH0G03740p [Lachancea thermotolerans CBS 6340]CAR24761.1 KLTH0G03740p [Lachancea thermotolerans CBS 6340]
MLESSVKVDDYFDNDENGLWSWYLCNLRHGNFEELNNNQLKFALLRRFLNEQLLSDSVLFNKKLLLVSIPDAIHENTNLLENFLRDYFNLDDLQFIQIQKLTQDRCYNHENHYLISDSLSNFNDKSFLEFGAKSRRPRDDTEILGQDSNNQYSIISGETEADPALPAAISSESPASVHLSKVVQEDVPLRTHNSSSRLLIVDNQECASSTDESDDASTELVLKFEHRGMLGKQRLHPEVRKMASTEEAIDTPSTGVSLRSDDVSSYDGEVLTQTITRDEDSVSLMIEDDSISELSSVDHSLKSLSYDSEYSQGSSSLTSIFPSISISEKFGRFRLVLQSILVHQPDTRQLFTAVRQSNNDPTVAHVNDDWLLYDDKFSMNNLQILALHDVLEMNKFFPKILFYSLVMISEEVAADAQDYYPSKPSKSPQPTASNSTISENTLKVQPTLTHSLTNTNSYLSTGAYNSSLSPFYSSVQHNHEQGEEDDYYDDDKNSEGVVVPLYSATRTNSNKSTAHRSIRTIKSIGDWAFHHDSSSRKLSPNDSTLEDSYQSVEGNLMKVRSKSSVKSGLTKTLTLGSLSTVERSKSVPLPSVLKSLSNFDEEALYLKKKVEKFKRKRLTKRKKNEPNCLLM